MAPSIPLCGVKDTRGAELTHKRQHPGASKQDVVAQAAQMALKMWLKSEMGGSAGGAGAGAGAGGSSGLMSLASKLL